MEYKGNFKYLQKEVIDTTANRCIIIGIIDALKILKEPCEIKIVTSTLLGIKKWEKNRKGVNADLLTELHLIAIQNTCIISFEALESEGQKVKNLATF